MYIVNDRLADLESALTRAAEFPPLRESTPSYVTVGVFDGVHRGHLQIISTMVEKAHASGNIAITLVFDPHPAAALGHKAPPLLTTLEERVDLLAAVGLDILVVVPFTSALAQTPATEFVAALSDRVGLVELWGGPDLALGYRREGNLPFLRRLGAEMGFSVQQVAPLFWNGRPVSSSRIRMALQVGDIVQATGCLGRPYRLAGVVVHGDGRGRTMGVPTANLSFSPARLIPANGIYACQSYVGEKDPCPAAVNVGARPTFNGHDITVEAHLINFKADLYGQEMALDFIARLRDEMAFPNVEALMAQMQKDIAQVQDVLGDVL
jgi:riboflavin kinase/FMN adenylyltransferase